MYDNIERKRLRKKPQKQSQNEVDKLEVDDLLLISSEGIIHCEPLRTVQTI